MYMLCTWKCCWGQPITGSIIATRHHAWWTIHYSIITDCLSKYVRTCKYCWGQPTAGSIITLDNKLFHNKKQTVYMYLQMLLRATNCRLHYCYYHYTDNTLFHNNRLLKQIRTYLPTLLEATMCCQHCCLTVDINSQMWLLHWLLQYPCGIEM